jgi:pimeloyl-ACP methyl ester carboxylesterase
MTRAIIVFSSLLALSACAYPITAEDAFQPPQGSRLGVATPLEMRAETRLSPARITHQRIESAAGPIAVTLVDQPDTDRLIVLCMGNAADRVKDGANYADDLLPFADVLLWDYPGYGQSGGKAEIADFEAAIAAVTKQVKQLDRPTVIAWGHSLGGFVCAQMVGSDPQAFDAMVFEASARNAEEVARSWMPLIAKPFLRIEVRDGLEEFDSAAALHQFGGAIHVLAAGEDTILEPALSRALAQALNGEGRNVSFFEFAGADHDSISASREFGPYVRDVLMAGF